MDHMETAQEAVLRMYGAGYDTVAACAAVAARTFTVNEYDREVGEPFEALKEAVLKNAPACWARFPDKLVAAVMYVHHLELGVGVKAHNLNVTRHVPDCNGECS